MRDGGPAMTAALRIETAAGAATGQVLASGKVNQWPGNLPDQTQRARARAAGISVRTQRKLDRLARDRPDLLAEVKAGRMSAHRAALEAGIVGKATEDGVVAPRRRDQRHRVSATRHRLALPTLVQEDARLAREMREHGFDPTHPLVIRPLGDGYQVVASARDYSSPASSRRRWLSSAL